MVFSLGASELEEAADTRKRRRVGFVGFDGFRALDLTGPLETFAAARRDSEDQESCYEVVVIGLTGKNFVSESGIVFKAQETIETTRSFDTIIIPGGRAASEKQKMASLCAWLFAQAPQTRRIVGVCGGIYPLAYTGLLDGRRATTHWRFVTDVARRFPKVRLTTNSSFVKDGPFHTCGGGPSAGVEMTLSMIGEDFGAQTALSLARDMVVRLRPPGSTDEIIAPSDFQAVPAERLADLPAWIVGHLHENLSVDILAERACICPRHFGRLFKTMFGVTPAHYVEAMRLKEAGRRLLSSRASIETVAAAVGFRSSDSFRRAFERSMGVTPNLYRRTRSSMPQVSGSRNSSRPLTTTKRTSN